MPKYLVISTSGNAESNSRIMGRVAFDRLQKQKADCDWIDISGLELPLCDADKCYLNPAAQKLKKTIEAADGTCAREVTSTLTTAARTASVREAMEASG